MTTNKFESRQDNFKTIIQATLNNGHYSDAKHSIDVYENCTIWVTDLRANKKVAFSSTKADFEQSLAEFVTDYFE